MRKAKAKEVRQVRAKGTHHTSVCAVVGNFRGSLLSVGSGTGAVLPKIKPSRYSSFLWKCLKNPDYKPFPAPVTLNGACKFSYVVYDFTSILKFIEIRFGLRYLTMQSFPREQRIGLLPF